MTAPLTLIVLMAAMYAAGVYIMLERSLTRLLIGFLLVGNATNVLIFLMSGDPGRPPLIVDGDLSSDGMTDPLPQALILTAIVINFGITSFVLALIYRSWWLAQLGDEGDTLPDEHVDETPEDQEETFRQLDDDDAAVQQALDESDDDGNDGDRADARETDARSGDREERQR